MNLSSLKIILLLILLILDTIQIHGIHNNSVIFKNDLLGWDITKFGNSYKQSNQVTVDNFQRLKIIDKFDKSCLTGTFNAQHAINDKYPARKGDNLLDGTTYWINEFQAVGHAMYDISLIQLLSNTNITRIILQRAPCATHDLCLGIGTWESFYKNFYTIALNSAGKGGQIPIYMRFYKNATHWNPYFLGKSKNMETKSANRIQVLRNLCFDRVIRRTASTAFHNSVSPDVARSFKKAAYELYNEYNKNNKIKSSSQPIITIAHRGDRYRSMNDPELLRSYLQEGKYFDEFYKFNSYIFLF
jgi:hypothetical protein